MIKRLQTNITGRATIDPTKLRAPSAYGGYFAGLTLDGLPPNAIESNKFIQPEVPAGPTVVEVNFLGEMSFSSGVSFPSATTVTFHFVNVGSVATNNSLYFQLSNYDFNSSTLVITSPPGYSLSVIASVGAVYFVNGSNFSVSPEWLVTLTVPTPISQLDYISFEPY